MLYIFAYYFIYFTYGDKAIYIRNYIPELPELILTDNYIKSLILSTDISDGIPFGTGSANGVATLDSNGKVPASQLPSYVDDVIEVYGISGTTALTSGWLSTTSNGSAITPETGKIYVLMADFPSTNPVYSTNSQFRWSGSSYVQIYDSGVSAITNVEIDTIVAN